MFVHYVGFVVQDLYECYFGYLERGFGEFGGGRGGVFVVQLIGVDLVFDFEIVYGVVGV